MPARKTMPIAKRALLTRVRGKLEALGRTVRAVRGSRANELGPFYEVDTSSGRILRDRMSLEDVVALGRELGAVEPWEEVAS